MTQRDAVALLRAARIVTNSSGQSGRTSRHTLGQLASQCPLPSHDGIRQLTEPVDRNPHHVASHQRERQVGHEARPGRQHYALGELIGPEQVLDQVAELAVQLFGARMALPGDPTIPLDRQVDAEVVGVGDVPIRRDPRAERTAAEIGLGLGQI